MFNHLIFFLRNLRRDRFYSAINVSGLAIGMAASILILLWIHYEWSFDRFHAKEKLLYRVWYRVKNDGHVECHDRTSIFAGPALKSNYPDIIETTRVIPTDMYYVMGEQNIKVQTVFVDPGFLSMFSFPLLQGDAASALNDQYSVILVEETARRFFGDDDPMGKTMSLPNGRSMTVTGIIQDMPNNTIFEFEALISVVYGENRNIFTKWWGNHVHPTFVELHPQAREDCVNQSIKSLIREQTNNDLDGELFLFPLSKSHLYTKSQNGIPIGGLIDTLRLFGLVAFLILMISCINFMNLSIARADKRAREIGVRKVLGGRKFLLVWLFLSESTLLALISCVMAIMIVVITLPAYNTLLGKSLSLDLTNGWMWLSGLVFILFSGLLAGSYPAFYLSSFMPLKTQPISPRRALVILQFTVAIFLIISTLVIHRQVRYAQSRNSGYEKEHLIYLPMIGIGQNYEVIKHDLLNAGIAKSVTRTFAPMTEQWADAIGVKWRGGEPDSKVSIDIFFADDDWVKTVGATIVEGRNMDITNFPTDATAALLNESAVKTMGFDHPIGEEIEFWAGKVHVVGVIKDFILHSPYDPTKPMIIAGSGFEYFNTLHIRLNEANKTADNLKNAETIFKKHNPIFPFEYRFIDATYSYKFQKEKTIGSLSSLFACLTIIISCLGLLALVAYMAEVRKKEIGIRKVLGASVFEVIVLLTKEFLMLVLFAIAIATPLAWWAMNRWLDNFAYRTNIPWWLFVVIGGVSLCIALLTVGFQAFKAATANPVEAIIME